MSEYKDRGIIKWSPFDSLSGFNDLYKELKYRLGKLEKPILSEDKLYELDLHLNNAFINKLDVSITYYDDGYTKELFGIITKIDHLNQIIYLEKNKFKIDLVIDIYVYD